MNEAEAGRTALVVYSGTGAAAGPDELDTIAQADAVAAALAGRGYRVERVPVEGRLDPLLASLQALAPALVFHLAEATAGHAHLAEEVAEALERRGVAFTGAGAAALARTTDKLVAKRALLAAGIATPDWLELSAGRSERDRGPASRSPRLAGEDATRECRWIVKSVCEDASIGIAPDSVVAGTELLAAVAADRQGRFGGRWFAERFIEGRELNVSLLAAEAPAARDPEVLPIAEICFVDWPDGVPRIVDYAAKWESDCVRYHRTPRSFLARSAEPALYDRVAELAVACWRLFGLGGYARVDFRVDAGGRPWVLEVNANPCIAPDAGFIAAAREAGYSFTDVVARIASDASRRKRSAPLSAAGEEKQSGAFSKRAGLS